MAKTKKHKKPSLIEAILLALGVTIFALYMVISFIETYTLKKELIQNLLAVTSKKATFEALNNETQVLLLVVMLLLFGFLVFFLKKDPKGYKDAAWHGAHGSAVFSELSEFREEGYVAPIKYSKWHPKNPYVALAASEGIILGRESEQLMIIPPDSKLDNRNVLVVGSSGSSKGQAFVINNIINNRTSSIVVTDPKGELYKLTGQIKRDQGFKVYQIDFLNLEGDGYNPLDYIETDLDAKRVALTIARNAAKDDKEDHWFSKGVELLTGLILYVKEEYPNPSIPVEIKREFNRANEDETYLKELCETIGENHVAYAYLKDASVAKGNERQSIFSTFTKHVGIFSSKKVAELTKRSDFRFDYLQDEISILYIKIPIKDNPVAALTATFFDQLISRMYTIGDWYDAKLPIPLIALLDEFANIGKLNEFDNTLSTCRGYDFSIITIVQDFAQLEQKYGKENARTIISNHDTTLFLRTKDTETAKYFETLAGDTTITYKTKGSSSNGAALIPLPGSSSLSTNENIVKKPLLSQSELLQIPADTCYAFLAGKVIELEKAYQSVIYKDFVTTTETVVVNGVKRQKFPYVYINNRQEYIKKFNFNPSGTVEEIKDEETTSSVETTTTVSHTPTKTLPQEETSGGNTIPTPQTNTDITNTVSNQKLQSLIADFMAKTEVNETKKEVTPTPTIEPIIQETTVPEVPETTIEKDAVETDVTSITIPEAIEITTNLITAKKSEFQLTSDPVALQELKELTSLNKLAVEIEALNEEKRVCDEISELFDIDERVITEVAAIERVARNPIPITTTDESIPEDIADLNAIINEPSTEQTNEDDNKKGNIEDLLPF